MFNTHTNIGERGLRRLEHSSDSSGIPQPHPKKQADLIYSPTVTFILASRPEASKHLVTILYAFFAGRFPVLLALASLTTDVDRPTHALVARREQHGHYN
jgi:hypothetical protein